MENKTVKKKVKEFRKSNSLKAVRYKDLKRALENLGYSIVEFNNVYNDKDVSSLVNALRLTEYISSAKSFAYADNNYRLVFVHEDLTEAEKALVVAHEVGHIFLGHMSQKPIFGKAVQEEYEANEFAHYLLNPKEQRSSVIKNVLIAVLAVCTLVLGIFALVPSDEPDNVNVSRNDGAAADNEVIAEDENVEYYGDFYITNTGSKYHKEQCRRIKDKTTKRRMTLEDYESGKYSGCDICLPEE